MRISDWSSDVCSSDLQNGRSADGGFDELLVQGKDLAQRRIRARRGRQALDVLEERAKVLVLEQGLGLREGGVAREGRDEGGLVGLVGGCEVLEGLRVSLVCEHEAVQGAGPGGNEGFEYGYDGAGEGG